MFSTLLALALALTPQTEAQTSEREAEKPAQTEERAKPEKVCRYIRGTMGSRRKEKVCLTKEEWREFNQGN